MRTYVSRLDTSVDGLQARLTNFSFLALHSQANQPHISDSIAICDFIFFLKVRIF